MSIHSGKDRDTSPRFGFTYDSEFVGHFVSPSNSVIVDFEEDSLRQI